MKNSSIALKYEQPKQYIGWVQGSDSPHTKPSWINIYESFFGKYFPLFSDSHIYL